MFRTSTDEKKKQKPTTRGGPRGFPIQLLCLTSVIGREPAYSAWYSVFSSPFARREGLARALFIYLFLAL